MKLFNCFVEDIITNHNISLAETCYFCSFQSYLTGWMYCWRSLHMEWGKLTNDSFALLLRLVSYLDLLSLFYAICILKSFLICRAEQSLPAEAHLTLLNTMGKFLCLARFILHLRHFVPEINVVLLLTKLIDLFYFCRVIRETMLTYSLDLVWVWSCLVPFACVRRCS